MAVNLTITGAPPVKKNSSQLVKTKEGRVFPVPNAKYKKWEREALEELAVQYRGMTIKGWIWVRALFYLPTARLSDLSNLLEAPADALERAGVIENDRNIVSWDGSRRYIDRDRPRIELLITRTDEQGDRR